MKEKKRPRAFSGTKGREAIAAPVRAWKREATPQSRGPKGRQIGGRWPAVSPLRGLWQSRLTRALLPSAPSALIGYPIWIVKYHQPTELLQRRKT